MNGGRSAAERGVREELDRWCERATADPSAPLSADDLVRLVRDCVATLGLDPEITSELTVNTVHYYRRKEIIDPPQGRTVSARYDRRHLWQVIGARLAGFLGLVTLAEARAAFRDASESELRSFVAARVVDARSQDALRSPAMSESSSETPAQERPRPLARSAASPASPASMISLPGGAICVIPADHDARRSREAARDLVRALARALEVSDSI